MIQTHSNKYIELIKVFWKPLMIPLRNVLPLIFLMPLSGYLYCWFAGETYTLKIRTQITELSLYFAIILLGLTVSQKWNTLQGKNSLGFPKALQYYPLSPFLIVGVLWSSVMALGIIITLGYITVWPWVIGVFIDTGVGLFSTSIILSVILLLTLSPNKRALFIGIIYLLPLLFLFMSKDLYGTGFLNSHQLLLISIIIVLPSMFGFTLWNYQFSRLEHQEKQVLTVPEDKNTVESMPKKTTISKRSDFTESTPETIQKKNRRQWIFHLEPFHAQWFGMVIFSALLFLLEKQSLIFLLSSLGMGIAAWLLIRKENMMSKTDIRHILPINDSQIAHSQMVYFYTSLMVGIVIIVMSCIITLIMKKDSGIDINLFAKMLFLGLIYSIILKIPETTIKHLKVRFYNLLNIIGVFLPIAILLRQRIDLIILCLLLYVLYLVIVITRKLIQEDIMERSKITRYSLLWAGCFLILEGLLIAIKGFSGSLESITLVGGIVTLLILPLFTIPLSVHLERHQ